LPLLFLFFNTFFLLRDIRGPGQEGTFHFCAFLGLVPSRSSAFHSEPQLGRLRYAPPTNNRPFFLSFWADDTSHFFVAKPHTCPPTLVRYRRTFSFSLRRPFHSPDSTLVEVLSPASSFLPQPFALVVVYDFFLPPLCRLAFSPTKVGIRR